MVNFRYHIVSIVAVFLALGIGILAGTTVVNQETLDFLEGEIADADKAVDRVQRENSDLRDEIEAEREMADRFAEETAPALLGGRLRNVPVLVVSTRGIDDAPLEDLRTALGHASATYEGTLWLTDRMRLDDEEDVDELGGILGVATRDGDAIRPALARALAAALVSSDGAKPGLIGDLLGAGFIDYQQPGSDAPDGEALPLPGTRVAVVGGAGAEIADEAFLEPLVDAMAGEGGGTRVVVASAGPRPDAEEEEQVAARALVEAVRDDDRLADRVSTVDNLDRFPGQAATVLALEDLGSGIVGHYGVADGADGLVPPEAP